MSPSHARPLFSHCFLLTEWLYALPSSQGSSNHPFLKQSTRSVPVPLWVQQSWGRGTMYRRRESGALDGLEDEGFSECLTLPFTAVSTVGWSGQGPRLNLWVKKKKKKKMHNVRGIWKRKRLESERKRAGNILSLLLCEKCYKFVKYSTLLPEILSYLFGRGCNWQFYCKKEEKNKKYRNCMSYHWEK